MTLDLISGIVTTYYFQPQDMFYALNSLYLLPPRRLFMYGGWAFVIVVPLAILSYTFRKSIVKPVRLKIALALLCVTLVLVSIDIWNRYCILTHPDVTRILLLRFPEASLVKRWISSKKYMHSKQAGRMDGEYSDSASERGFSLVHNLSVESKLNIVEVLVESWGNDEGVITNQLLANYRTDQINSHYKQVTGTIPFWGPTVSGEVRELCHSTLGFGILHSTEPSVLTNCMPSILKQQGYHTEAIHGYFGEMFERSHWYPKVGFETLWFKNSLHQQGLEDCVGSFAFPGICDSQISHWIGKRLAQTKTPTFFYWVTLNSHLPLPSNVNGLNPVSCSFDSQVNQQESLCAWFKLEYSVHQSIANMILMSNIQPTAFFIVGDHAPPFADPQIRKRFSDSNVPFILLIPKSIVQK